MKAYIVVVVSFGMVSPTMAIAKVAPTQQPPVVLIQALNAMVADQNSPPIQSAQPKPPDHDQGDDNASPRAISVVCSKDTPAAQRSAICPQPISPN
jgi:hypothetical protein